MPSDAFVTLISIQPASSANSVRGEKFQNRPQACGVGPGALFEARRQRAIMRAKLGEGSGVTLPPSPAYRPHDIEEFAAAALPSPSHVVRVSWLNPATVQSGISYRLWYGTTPIFDTSKWAYVELDPQPYERITAYYDHPNRLPGTTYYYAIQGVNQYGFGRLTGVVYATTPLDPPAAPKNVSMFSVGVDAVAVWWPEVPGADSYAVYVDSLIGVSKLDTRHVATKPPKYLSVPGGGPFFARVASVGVAGEGDLSNESTITATTTAPVAPANLTAGVGVVSGEIALAWDAVVVPNLTSYRLYRAEALAGPYSLIQTFSPAVRTFTDTGRTETVTYHYKVSATSLYGGEGAQSVAASSVPYGNPPTWAVQPFVTGTTDTSITLGYHVADAENDPYRLDVSVNGGGYYTLVSSELPGAKTVTFSGLTTGETYTYQFKATPIVGTPTTITSGVATGKASSRVSLVDANTVSMWEFENATDLLDEKGAFPILGANLTGTPGLRGNAVMAGKIRALTASERATMAAVLGNEWTVEGWFYYDSANAAAYPTVFGVTASSAWDNRMFLMYANRSSGNLEFDARTATGRVSSTSIATLASIQNRWAHFAVRRYRATPGVNTSFVTEIFINGIRKVQMTGQREIVDIAGGTVSLELGNGAVTCKHDSYRLSNVSRSDAEIESFRAYTRAELSSRPNLFANPGFETANDSGWTSTPSAATQTVVGVSDGVTPHGGSYQMRMLQNNTVAATLSMQTITREQYLASAGYIGFWARLVSPASVVSTSSNRIIFSSVIARDAGGAELARTEPIFAGKHNSGATQHKPRTFATTDGWWRFGQSVKDELNAALAAAGKSEADIASVGLYIRGWNASGYAMTFMLDDAEYF